MARRRKTSRTPWLIFALLLAGAAAGAAGFYLVNREKPAPAARTYLQAWQASQYDRMQSLVLSPSKDFEQVHRQSRDDLMATQTRFRLGTVTPDGSRAVARFSVHQSLKGLGDWSYRSRLILRRQEGEWRVKWDPQTLHPGLSAGTRLGRGRTWAQRAPILAADGSPITAGRAVVVVGIQPGRVSNRDELASALAPHVETDRAEIDALLNRPGVRPDWFLPVDEVPEERYQQIRPAIYDVPGVVFQRKQDRLPPTEDFARQVIGRVGEATEEALGELGEPYLPGDRIGLFGLEKAMEKQLAGRPSGEIKIVDEGGRTVRVLRRFPGEEPRPVHTTLDVKVQNAVDAALAGAVQPSAIVVVDSSTSEVRAVASRPVNGFNRAVEGRYPPGSTFKVVTTAALLSSGTGPENKVECPAETKVGGKTFRNFEGKSLGSIDFRTAFVESCNTAFANLVRSLDNQKLMDAAALFGFGSPYEFPLRNGGAHFPPPRDETERVAASIGQARVEASPMHMATVAGAVAAGAWRPPKLVVGRPDESRPLEPSVNERLAALMRGVVEEGTGELAAVPGRRPAGKTGTAEYGTSRPPRTHAWFIGFSGPLAFAVLVEGGGVGGEVAAPLAARLIAAL